MKGDSEKEEKLINEEEDENDPQKYYSKYKQYISELNNLEKDIRKQLVEFKEKSKSKENTIGDENKLKTSFNIFKEKLDILQDAYSDNNAPATLPSSTLDIRQKELQQFQINLHNWRKQFIEIQNEKYSFKDKIEEDYMQKEEYKTYTTGELQALQKDNLKKQDEKIDEIKKDIKKNITLAKNATHTMKEQNKTLEQISEEMEITDEKMKTITGRFKNYAKRQSWCCLVVILIIELVIALGAYFIFLN
jgi:chromosome segregation ATPase